MGGCSWVSIQFYLWTEIWFYIFFIYHKMLFFRSFSNSLKNVKVILSSRPSKNSQQARFGLGATGFGKPCSRVQKTLHQAAFWNLLSRLLRANAASNSTGNPAPGSPAWSLPEPTPSAARLSRCFLLSISPSVPEDDHHLPEPGKTHPAGYLGENALSECRNRSGLRWCVWPVSIIRGKGLIFQVVIPKIACLSRWCSYFWMWSDLHIP